MAQGVCVIAGCGKPRLAREWCSPHYWRWNRYGDPLAGGTPQGLGETALFWRRVDKSADCWVWTGARQPRGYGTFTYSGKGRVLAHVWAWRALHGPVPDGLELDHHCRNHSCVRPDHLEPVTHRVNILRGTSPAALNAVKTHCVNGHEFNESNTGIRKGTEWRYCKQCRRDRKAVTPARQATPA